MTDFNFACGLEYEISDNRIKFRIGDYSTGWMAIDDSFVERIKAENINRAFPKEHLLKEIEIKNVLDEGVALFKSEKYAASIKRFDEVLFYDTQYVDALVYKSHSLFCQKHFVKALRHYKKAVKAGFKGDMDYHKLLLTESSHERDNFPKIKASIYAGDEHFSRGEWKKALESYEKALANTSKFKNKILFRLLNKKATTLVKLNEFESALVCFNESLNALNNDYACFGKGVCEHRLGLAISECFFYDLKISKKQILVKAEILNDIGEYKKAVECWDFLLKNHFRCDEMYVKILEGKRTALSNLGLATGEVDSILKLVQ